MSDSKTGRAVGLALELLVVFLGVLIALAADSWWQQREEIRQELAYLSAVASDMDEASRLLRDAIEENLGFLARADSVVRVLDGDAPPPSEGRVGRARMSLSAPGIPLGALQALLTTGDLRLVRSTVVRAELISRAAELDASLGWVQDVARQAGDNVRDLMHTWEELAIPARRAGTAISLDVLRASPDLIAEHRIYLIQMANIVGSQRQALEAVEAVQVVVAAELEARR